MTANPSASTNWRQHAACRGLDPNLFIPDTAGGDGSLLYLVARSVCERCPVRLPCLDFAVATTEKHGMWGGCTPEERKLLRRSTA